MQYLTDFSSYRLIPTHRGNKSIGFDISARSVAANLNADLNIELYAYGKNVSACIGSLSLLCDFADLTPCCLLKSWLIQYINITANLCDIIGGALCPLPQYQFDGSFAYILPDSL